MALLASRYSAPGAEQNLPAGSHYRRPSPANAPATYPSPYHLILAHECTALPANLVRLGKTSDFYRFLFVRCQRAIKNLPLYAVSVLNGHPPHLLKDDLLTLCRDLGEVPVTDSDWQFLAELAVDLDRSDLRFATVRLQFRYRHRLYVSTEERGYRTDYRWFSFGSDLRHADKYWNEELADEKVSTDWCKQKVSAKATALLLDRHPEWTPSRADDVYQLVKYLADRYHDFRYLARLVESVYLPAVYLFQEYLAEHFQQVDASSEWYFLQYFDRHCIAHCPSTAPALRAHLTELLDRLPRIVVPNLTRFSLPTIHALVSGKSIRTQLPFRPGKRLLRLFHQRNTPLTSSDFDLWSHLMLTELGCPSDQWEFLRDRFQLRCHIPTPAQRRHEPQYLWWNDVRKLAFIRRVIEWQLYGGEVFDYLMHQFRNEPQFTLHRRTLASVTRLSVTWHQEIFEEEARKARLQQRRRAEVLAGIERRMAANRIARQARNGQPLRQRTLKPPPRPLMRYTPTVPNWLTKKLRIVQLLDHAELAREGMNLKHCVASYAYLCESNSISIHALEQLENDEWASLLTIEVRTKGKKIAQVKGLRNRAATEPEMKEIRQWAKANQLVFAEHLTN